MEEGSTEVMVAVVGGRGGGLTLTITLYAFGVGACEKQW